ncbi:MAG: MFS transporter [Clostridiaceae bacterium]
MRKNRNIILMYLIVFLQGFIFYGPVATIYRTSRGLSMYNLFLIESVYWILMIIFEIPFGYFADYFGYKKTLIISNFLLFISKIIFWKAYSFSSFMLERVFLSMALAGISGCDTALLYSSCDKKSSEKVLGEYSSFSTFGFLLASLMSGFIISISLDATSFYTIFPHGAAFILTLFIKDVPTEKTEHKMINSFIKVLKNKNMLLLILGFSIMGEVVQSITVFLNQTQYVRSGINIRYFGIILAFAQILNMSSAKSYMISSKFGISKSIGSLILLITVCPLVLTFTKVPMFSIIFVLLSSLCMSLIRPMVINIENKSIILGDRATILSMYAIIGDVASALINPLIGKGADISIEAAFTICFALSLIAFILFLIYKKREPLF